MLEGDPQPAATARQLRMGRSEVPPVKQLQWGLRRDKSMQGDRFKQTQGKFGALKKMLINGTG